MPTGYRGVILALGLILCGAAPPKEQPVRTEAASQVQPTVEATPDYSPYPRYNPDPCYQAKNHDTADLCAQWRAAIAAEKAANASHQSNLIGGLGGLLSFISIVLVFIALRQTERSLKEARAANQIAQASANRQLRAYLMTEDHQIQGFWRAGPTTMILKLYNRGQTPAYDVRVWSIVTGTLGDPSTLKIHKPKNNFQQSTDVIGPGNFSLHVNDCQAPLDGDAYLGVVNGALKLVFAGIVTYRDAFGRRRFTVFKHFYVGDGNFKTTGGDLTACGRRNLAS